MAQTPNDIEAQMDGPSDDIPVKLSKMSLKALIAHRRQGLPIVAERTKAGKKAMKPSRMARTGSAAVEDALRRNREAVLRANAAEAWLVCVKEELRIRATPEAALAGKSRANWAILVAVVSALFTIGAMIVSGLMPQSDGERTRDTAKTTAPVEEKPADDEAGD